MILQRHTSKYKRIGRAVFGPFGLLVGIVKWKALNGLVDTSRNIESVAFLDAGWFESSNRCFKKL